MIQQFVIENLSDRGPGTWIDGLERKARRKGFKSKDFYATLRSLMADGYVERLGQYLWLKKGAAECKSQLAG